MTLRSILAAVLCAMALAPAGAAGTLTFSGVDPQTPPQVFVRDAGVRGARPDDDPNVELYNANGDALLFTLEKWRAASGTAEIGPDGDGPGDRVILVLHRLIPFGHYSVAVRANAADGPRFSPIDGSGIGNNFDARQDGNANVVVTSPAHVAPGSAIVVVYHSDAQDHGSSPGDFGRTAHQQLIVRIP